MVLSKSPASSWPMPVPNRIALAIRQRHGNQAYCDSKPHDILLAFAVVRRWLEVRSLPRHPRRLGGPARMTLPDA